MSYILLGNLCAVVVTNSRTQINRRDNSGRSIHFQNAKYRENVLQACGNSVGNPTAQAQAALAGGSITDPSGGGAAAAALSDPHGKIKRLEQLSENLKFDTISQVNIYNIISRARVCLDLQSFTCKHFLERFGEKGKLQKQNCHQPPSKQGKQKETRIQFKSKQSLSAVVDAHRAATFFWLKFLLKFSKPFLKKVRLFETFKVQVFTVLNHNFLGCVKF